MLAVSTSETSVNLYKNTRRTIPENSHLHTRRRESLKSHEMWDVGDYFTLEFTAP
jgi:hypothetical protein